MTDPAATSGVEAVDDCDGMRAAPPAHVHASDLLLDVRGLVAGHGEGMVLQGLSFNIRRGESLVVIGRNGVGKTTLLESIIGLTVQSAGEIWFEGRRIDRNAPYRRNRNGIGWVPQEREVFPSLTVLENLSVVARRGAWTIERVYALFPRLRERQKHFANHLSGGEQQMLAVGRALMTDPKLLLLDEPMEGLAPVIVAELLEGIHRMRSETDMTVIMVEQKYDLALNSFDRCIAIDRGVIAYDGPSRSLLDDEALLATFVGVES